MRKKGPSGGVKRMQYLSIKSFALKIDSTEKAVRCRIARRQVPFIRLGKRILIPESAAQEFLGALPGVSPEEAATNVSK